MNRQELYQACKWEATYFNTEHGMNTSDMWEMVHGRIEGFEKCAQWWLNTCLEDYREQRIF